MDFNASEKKAFRENGCNIARIEKNKVPDIKKNIPVLLPLQTPEKFESLLQCENWGVTQTENSIILLFDSDHGTHDRKLERFFNRTRDKYVGDNKLIRSKHGFIKVTDADHDWCVNFARRYHNKVGIEIYAEKHYVAFAGTYYNDKNIDPYRETTWFPKDDLHKAPILEFTKAQLEEVFTTFDIPEKKAHKRQHTTSAKNRIKKGLGRRHNALVLLVLNTINLIAIKNKNAENADSVLPVTFESVYKIAISTKKIDGIEEYEINAPKFPELRDIINWSLKEYESKEIINTPFEFLLYLKKNFAHIKEDDDEFNCWYWDGNRWRSDIAHFVSEVTMELTPLIEEMDKSKSRRTAELLSSDENTLKIEIDEDYVKQSMNYITNKFGEYFDFRDGFQKDVTPDTMFYREPHLMLPFNSSAKDPEKFLAFVNELFSEDDVKILLDHLAGTLLHTSVLGAKPKMLTVVGPTDLYKSLIIEILKMIIHPRLISMHTNEQIGARFGLSMIADKMLNYSEELNAVESDNPAAIKNAITMESGYVEYKNGKHLKYASRFPRHLMMCNKLAPISHDDDDKSIFNRNQYLKIKDDVKISKDWRKVILGDEEELQNIMMFLLRRAHEIYTGQKPLIQQDVDVAKNVYLKLTRGSIEQIINEHYTKNDKTATSWDYFCFDIKNRSGENISRKRIKSIIEDLGYSKNRDRYFRQEIRHAYTMSSPALDDEKVQVTVIEGLLPKTMVSSA